MKHSWGYWVYQRYALLLIVLSLAAVVAPKAFGLLALLGAPMQSPTAHIMVPIMLFCSAVLSLMLARASDMLMRAWESFILALSNLYEELFRI